MAFFRIKKIKGKEYCYVVENEWVNGKTRQKVKGYVGRAYRPVLKKDISFSEFKKIDDVIEYMKKSEKEIVSDLVEWEKERFGLGNFSIDAEKKRIALNGKDCALMINEGYLCGMTLRNLLDYKPMRDEQDTFTFARCFVEAGIKVPEEIFVGICQKILEFEN